MKHHYSFMRLLLLAICCFSLSGSVAQTLMPLPAHSMVYPGNVRGYWFTAPTNFTITGLRVASQAGTGTQSIHVFKINDPTPIAWPLNSSNFTTLAYITNAANNVIQNVNITVATGDKIAILGGVASGASMANSYGGTSAVTNATTINGNAVTLYRILYQGSITAAAAPNYSTEPGSWSISRVEMYYSTGPFCPAPTGLTSSGITMTSANFNWTAVTGSQGYEYAVTTTAAPPASGTPISTTSYSATGLNNGTNYWFHVRNQCSTSNYSAWVTQSFSTVACPSVPLATVSVTGITTVAANISWTAVSGSQGYEYALTTSATPPSSGTVQTTTTHNATGLFPGTNYYFHIRNQCASPSNSVWTTKSFSTLACPSAGPPTIGSNTPGTVTYSWTGTSVAGLTNYQYAVTSSSALPSAWQTTSNTTATVSGLTPGNTYYAHVRSNCTNSQAPDQWVQFVNPFPPCYAPAAISISGVNMHGAYVSWNSSIGTNTVQYQYAVNTNAVPPTSGTNTTDTFYTPTGLTAGQKYYVYVRTHCGTTNYSPWTRDSFTTPVTCLNTPPPAISGVTSSAASITWDQYPGIYGYEYVLNNNPATPTITGAAINFNSFSPGNLFSGTTYYFHLRVRCDTFNYSPYITTSFTTQSVCTPPSGLVMTAVTPTTATFSWSPVPGAQQYQYNVSTSSTPVAGITFTSMPTVKVQSLTPGTAYYFHVRANCSASDTSGWESIAFNTTAVSVGSVSSSGNFDVVIYPNPARDMLHVEVSGKPQGNAVLMLYDMSGKMLRQTVLKGQEGTIDLTGLSQGMYLLRYRDGASTGVLRVQKL